MIIMIGGETHSGKSRLAQALVAATGYACTSIDHIKMGLIRAGYTSLTPMDSDEELTDFLWPVVREMIKTAIENEQNLIVEGCYIPARWRKEFTAEYLGHIRTTFLVMSEAYIRAHFATIVANAHAVENRGDDSWLTPELLIAGNRQLQQNLDAAGEDYVLIESEYPPLQHLVDHVLRGR